MEIIKVDEIDGKKFYKINEIYFYAPLKLEQFAELLVKVFPKLKIRYIDKNIKGHDSAFLALDFPDRNGNYPKINFLFFYNNAPIHFRNRILMLGKQFKIKGKIEWKSPLTKKDVNEILSNIEEYFE